MWALVVYVWRILGPEENGMTGPADLPNLEPATPTRGIGHIEADLVIQSVMVTRARLRGSNDLAAERARLDELIDEWQAARGGVPA